MNIPRKTISIMRLSGATTSEKPMDSSPLPRLRIPIFALFGGLMVIGAALTAGCTGRDHHPGPSVPAAQPLSDITSPAAGQQRPVSHYYDFLRAQLAARSGRLEEAVAFMKDAVDKVPDQVVVKKELAMLYIKQGRKDKALEMIQEALGQDPDNTESLIIAGSLWQSAGELDAARQAYEKVVENAPERENIALILARLYLQQEQFNRAAELMTDFVERFPGNYMGFYYLGKACKELGRLGDAADAYQRSLSIEPDLMEPRAALIDIYRHQGRDAKAVSQYQAILERDPRNVAAALELGVFYKKQGRTDKARAIWEDFAGRAGPDSDVIKAVTGMLGRQQYDDAIIALSGVLEHDRQNSALHYLAGAALYLSDKTGPAMDHFQQVASDSDFYIDAMIHQAIIYNRESKTGQAVRLLEAAMEKSDSSGKAALIPYLSAFYQEQEHYRQAESLLQQGLSINPGSTELLYELGVLYEKMGDVDAAIEKMKQVIEKDPENADALNYLGYTYADQNIHLDEAESLIRRALEQEPESGHILDSMGWVHYRQGDYQKARKYLEKAVEKIGDDPIIFEHLGDVYRKTDQPGRALEYYKKALENGSDHADIVKEKMDALRQEVSP
jgi:tetratricopeptide (TPR) repeat protein